jgi:DNA-binding response OmpR family regulator
MLPNARSVRGETSLRQSSFHPGDDANMRPMKLLLVEDDPLIQEWIKTELSDAGFDIVVAVDGSGALAELNADAARFDAVVTDIRLGSGPNGWDVGRHARDLIPGIPIVYISGDRGHEWVSNGVARSVMIAKPFLPAQLITTICALISDGDTNRTAADGLRHP